MADPKGFDSLRAFVNSLNSAKHSEYAAKLESKVAHEDAFEEMKAHILKIYDKVEAPHSFMDETGAIFDCVPVEQQLALKGTTERVPTAPDLPKMETGGGDERKDALFPAPLGANKTDHFGNVMQCPEGTIQMRRLTLDDLSRFSTLRDFFRKGPRPPDRPDRDPWPR